MATTVDTFDWNTVKIDTTNLIALTQLKEEFIPLLQRCQAESYPEEISRLKKGKPLKKRSHLLPLTPTLGSDSLLCVGGRAGKAKLSYENLHPVILPAKHSFTKQVARAFYEELLHSGTDFVLSHIKVHFWIIAGKEVVKSVKRTCPPCVRENAKLATQLMADLPLARLDTHTLPFRRTDVDYFGPFTVAYGRNRSIKRYGALFTCLKTRTMYLDLAASLSSDDFLLVFRRFLSFYGRPVHAL